MLLILPQGMPMPHPFSTFLVLVQSLVRSDPGFPYDHSLDGFFECWSSWNFRKSSIIFLHLADIFLCLLMNGRNVFTPFESVIHIPPSVASPLVLSLISILEYIGDIPLSCFLFKHISFWVLLVVLDMCVTERLRDFAFQFFENANFDTES